MALKAKGGMWCDTCQKPVAGQKSTNKVAKLSATVATGGLYPGVPSGYHCPTCGSLVRRRPSGVAWTRQDLVGGLVVAGIFAVLVGVVVGALAIYHATQGPTPPRTVPNVINMDLTVAKVNLKRAGLSYSYNKDQGTFGILNEANWFVCGEIPSVGTKTTDPVRLDVRHFSC